MRFIIKQNTDGVHSMNHTQHRLKGVLFAIIGATLWGLGGTVSDLLF